MGQEGFRLMVDRGRLTQRLHSLKAHTQEQAQAVAEAYLIKTNAVTAEVISRASGEVIAKYTKTVER